MNFQFPGIALALCILFSAMASFAGGKTGYRLIEIVDHDPGFFTQGIEVHNDIVYESSGLYGKSKVRRYRIQDNRSLAEVALPGNYFAEGLTLLNDTVYLLTWKENTLLLLDSADLSQHGELKYDGEGWGLANDGKHLIMSDGSDSISFRNTSNFEIERQIKVTWKGKPVDQINELEFAKGYLWANVWFSSVILKINPATGQVVAVYNLEKLVKNHTKGKDQRVLNGIAYDQKKKAFWVTGKNWPARYLVEF